MGRKDNAGKRKIRRVIEEVRRKHYTPDPLLDGDTSRAVSRASAVIKRHGDLLCQQLADVLGDCDDLVVFDGSDFPISDEADQHAADRMATGGPGVDLPQPTDGEARTVDVDLIVYDRRDGSITGYEVKRGHGPVDAGKRRQTLRDGWAIAAQLRAFAERRGYPVGHSDFKILSIYGRTGLPIDVTINGDALDAHFRLPISGPLWQGERYLRNCLRSLLDGGELPSA